MWIGATEVIALHGLSVRTAGAKQGVTVAIKKKLRRHNAVESVIGHMKADGRLARNFLKGTQGRCHECSLVRRRITTCAKSCAG